MLPAVRAAVDAGLLVSDGDGYAFGHALIRQVIYARILPGERRLLHRRLAEALADRPGSDPGLLARHWHLAGCQDRAAPAAVPAARHAVSVSAYPEAAKHYALAMSFAHWLPAAGPDLLEEAAQRPGRAIPSRPPPRPRTRWPGRAAPPSGPGGGSSGSGVPVGNG